MSNALRDEILELERQRVEAMVRADVAALAKLLGDDLSYVHSDGRTDTKESFLQLVAGTAIRYRSVDFSDQEVIALGDTAIVRGVARMQLVRESVGPQDYRVLFLDIWARRPEGWVMVAWQATRNSQV
jgi:ketosteroid isomerase-like protein